MAAEANLTTNFVKAQSIDFVEQYGKQLTSLFKMLGVQRKMPMAAGTTIKTYKSSVTLDGTKVAKGDIIPLSQVKLEDGDPIELEFDKSSSRASGGGILSSLFEKQGNSILIRFDGMRVYIKPKKERCHDERK